MRIERVWSSGTSTAFSVMSDVMPIEVMALNPLLQHVWRRARGPVGEMEEKGEVSGGRGGQYSVRLSRKILVSEQRTPCCPYKLDHCGVYRLMKAMKTTDEGEKGERKSKQSSAA